MDPEEATDALYAADLRNFVSERSRLAKELNAAGYDAEASAFAKLRKPTVAAWVLNQLSRTSRRDIDLLLDAGHRLRDAQQGILGGSDHETFERAKKTEVDTLRRLVRQAEQLLSEGRGSPSSSILGEVQESLRAAAVSEPGREMLARGCFTQPMGAQGFDVVSQLVTPTSAATRAGRKRSQLRDERTAAREKLKELKAQLRDAEAIARERARTADDLARKAEKAAEEVAAAKAHAEETADACAAAEVELDRLRRA
jgi:hypothetical protein